MERVEYELIRITKNNNGKLDYLNNILDEPENVGIYKDEMTVLLNTPKEVVLSVRYDSIPFVMEIFRNETEMYNLDYDIMTPSQYSAIYN